MDTEKDNYTLEQIPVNRRLVEELYSHGKITKEARKYALNLLYPHNQWGVWISRLLLTIGAALVLSGIVYFFAFNWAKIPPLLKLFSIQFGMIVSLIGAYYFSLERMSGQILLLAGSVLVGVFMAVFGQIYQTGADAYQLFMMWSLLILGFTVISNFAPQWIFWLVITNIFLLLWWKQAIQPILMIGPMILIIITILNGVALALREYYLEEKGYKWLEARWIRIFLILITLLPTLLPIFIMIELPAIALTPISLIAIIGLFALGSAYYVYRYILPDMWSLTIVVFCACIIVITAAFKILSEIIHPSIFFPPMLIITPLLMGIITIGIFFCAVIFLRKTAKKIEG